MHMHTYNQHLGNSSGMPIRAGQEQSLLQDVNAFRSRHLASPLRWEIRELSGWSLEPLGNHRKTIGKP